MNALDKLFARLRTLLPVGEAEHQQTLYRQDAAVDSRASRKRQKERQDKARTQHLAWLAQQHAPGDDLTEAE
jgi:hypothetical protein